MKITYAYIMYEISNIMIYHVIIVLLLNDYKDEN